MSERPKLRDLARSSGLLDGFHDWRGEWRETDDETRVALLAGVGVDASTEDAAARARENLRAEDSDGAQVAVLSPDDDRLDIEVARVRGDLEGVDLVVGSEIGEEATIPFSAEQQGDHVHLRIDKALRPNFGYYDVELRRGSHVLYRSLLLVPPSRCPSAAEVFGGARAVGVMVNLYTLRSEKNWGVGDFGDVRRAAERLDPLGAGFLGLSPVHATGNRGSGVSPYYPSSRRFLNPLYVDVTTVSGYDAASRSNPAVDSTTLHEKLARLRGNARLDHSEVLEIKLSVLEAAFGARSAVERTAADAYYRSEGEDLERFAEYETLAEALSRGSPGESDWRSWPSRYVNPGSAETKDLLRGRSRRVEFHRWLQFEADRQLAAASRASDIALLLDLAVGTAPGGAETWAHRDVFATGVELGCPPDDYSENGQRWGLAPLLPRELRRSGYRHLRRLLAANFRHAAVLRIDHAMGLVRQFWVPAGEPASRGGYVELPAAETFAVLAIESARAGAAVVAEDLGTVPNGFRELLARRGCLRTQVLYFERDADGEFRSSEEYASDAFVSANNHDLPPLAGFGDGPDLRARAEAGVLPATQSLEDALRARKDAEARLHRRLALEGVSGADEPSSCRLVESTTRFLARTSAALVGVSLDDLGDESDPVNVPGIVSAKRPAWTRRMQRSVEAIFDDPRTIATLTEAVVAVRTMATLPIDGCIDLHTFRPKEIGSLLTAYLQECRRRGLLEVRVVHGKGRGSLRRSVEALLPRIEGVASWRSGRSDEGGWGATLVELKPMTEAEEQAS